MRLGARRISGFSEVDRMASDRSLDAVDTPDTVGATTRRPVRRRRRVDAESPVETAPQQPIAAETSSDERGPVDSADGDAPVARPRRRKPRREEPATQVSPQPEDDFGQGIDVEVERPAAARTDASPVEGATESESEGDGYGPGGRRRRRRRRRGGSPPHGGPQQGGPPHGGGQHGGQQHSGPRHSGPPHQHGRGRNNRNNSNNNNRRDRDRQRPPVQMAGVETTGTIEGVLELHPKGYGFLRDPNNNYSAKETDPFVSSTVIEKHRLREGVLVRGEIGPGAKGQGPRLKSIETVDNRSVEDFQALKNFDELTPINPFEQIKLERGSEPVTMRVMDLLTPIGKGQRALIVSPPRSGKTMLLQEIADSVSTNHPEVHLIVLLIDERPEEVTEMRRKVRGEVVASSLDREVESHIRVSQLVIERAKRLAEEGKDVFILLDSITRLARAFNKWVNNSGRTGTGGLDIRALDIPKKLFGTARRFEEGGSLTVVGTALVETGGRMDDAIFQEFKGTGNMELVLSRELADRRIWPAIDIAQSGTRREEKILAPEVLEGVTLLRRSLISLSPVQAMEDLTRTLRKFPSNKEFLARVQQVM